MQPPTQKDINDVNTVLDGNHIRLVGAVPVADYEALLKVARYWKARAQGLNDLDRFHDAAKMIEYDGAQAYRTCCERFGKDVANALLIAYFRRNVMTGSPLNVFPEPEDLREKVNKMLEEEGVL